nr:hypothetical protein [Clostridium botulinum]
MYLNKNLREVLPKNKIRLTSTLDVFKHAYLKYEKWSKLGLTYILDIFKLPIYSKYITNIK